MDLRAYYKKVRETETGLPKPYVVTVSLETADGGKDGVCTEVETLTAAKHITEGRARVATPKEAAEYHARNQEVRKAYDDAAAMKMMQFVVVSNNDGQKGKKE